MKLGFGRILRGFALSFLPFAAGMSKAENVLTFARTPDCYVSTTGRITTTAFTVEMWIRQTGFDSEN